MELLTTLKKTIAVALTLSAFATSCYTGIDVEPKIHASFDVPDGWVIVDDQPGYVSIVTEDPPLVKIETVPNETIPGSQSDAMAYARGLEEFYVGVTPPAQRLDRYQELSLSSGRVVYIHIVPDYFLGGSEPSWSSRLVYHADGYIVNLYMSDDATEYADELDLIVSSTSVSNR